MEGVRHMMQAWRNQLVLHKDGGKRLQLEEEHAGPQCAAKCLTATRHDFSHMPGART